MQDFVLQPPWSVYAIRLLVDTLGQKHLLIVVNFAQLHLDDFATAGLYRSADESSFNRQLAVAAIDQRQKLHAARPAMIEERVERSAHCATGVEHIIDENDIASVDVETESAWIDDRTHVFRREVIAIEADVENANVHGVLLNLPDQRAQSLGKRNAAPLHSNQPEIVTAIVLLDDLVGEPDECSLDFGGGHDAALLAKRRPGACLCVCHKYWLLRDDTRCWRCAASRRFMNEWKAVCALPAHALPASHSARIGRQSRRRRSQTRRARPLRVRQATARSESTTAPAVRLPDSDAPFDRSSVG